MLAGLQSSMLACQALEQGAWVCYVTSCAAAAGMQDAVPRAAGRLPVPAVPGSQAPLRRLRPHHWQGVRAGPRISALPS